MKIEDFGPFTLSVSAHSGPEEGMCVMEMVSFLAGDKWSDMPECASPALSRFCQVINDRFGQEQRDQLQQFVPMLIGTRSPEHEQVRFEILAWAAVRKFAPFYLRKAGMIGHAEHLEQFSGSLAEARWACREARDAANAYAAKAANAYAANAAAYAYAKAADAANAAAANAADAANAANAAAANAYMFPTVLEVLREAIEAGPHGTAYSDIHRERAAELVKVLA